MKTRLPVASRGFSLVELMFVVSIIGLLVAIGFLAYQQAYKHVLARCITQDLRKAETAVKIYICEHFELPPATDGYYLAPELLSYMPNGWPSMSLLGVDWKWCFWPAVTGAYFRIEMGDDFEGDPSLREALTLCDEQMDNGNTHNGRLKIGGQNRLWYAIEDFYWHAD